MTPDLTVEEELELAREKIEELEGALKQSTEFNTARQLPQPTMFWLYARNMRDFFLTAKAAIAKANVEKKFNPEEQEARKIVFEIEMHSGEIKGCHLED